MARSGSDISTRIGFDGGDEVKKQLEALARAGEKALSDLQKNFANSKNPFSGLSGGADEVKRHFDNLALSSQRAGNTIRGSLVSAIAGTNNYGQALQKTGVQSKNLQFALTNLSFQVNDVVSGLASGQDPMRIFAQQAGQIFQVFQTGGGISAVLGGAATAIKGLITPATVAAAAVGALAIGFGVLIARAQSADQSAKSFDIQLRAIGKSGQLTGQQLEDGAQSLRDVGLSASEAREELHKALNEGVQPKDTVKIVRIGANVASALQQGKEGISQFTAAAGKGGQALREYGEKLGIIPKFAKEVQAELKAAADSIDEANKRNREFNDIIAKRNQALADDRRTSAERELDEQRKLDQELKDLTRTRGADEEELKLSFRRREEEAEIQKNRRIADINRQANREMNELLIKRNRDAAQKLKEFNDKVLADAQEAASLLAQIDKQTKDAAINNLTPVGQALRQLNIAWNDLLNSMSKSSIIAGAVSAIGGLAKALTTGFQNNTFTTIALITGGIAALGVAALIVVPIFSALAAGVTAIVAGFTALAGGATAVATGLAAIAVVVGWPAVLLAGVVALTAAFVDWGAVLSGKTWSDFLATLDALWRMLVSIAGYLSDTFMQVWNSVWEGIKTAFTAVVQFFSDQIATVKGAFDSLANSVSAALGKALSVVKAAASILGFNNGGLIPGFAFGGPISGPGGIDRVPIWATAGEYMIKKPSVDYLGVGFMNLVNRFPERVASMLSGQRFATGGLIDWQPPVNTDNFARGGFIEGDLNDITHDRVSVDLTMPNGEVFEDMLTPRVVANRFGRYARQRSRVAIGRRPAYQS